MQGKPQVLVLNGTPDVLKGIRRQLPARAYAIASAQNAKDAHARLAKRLPNVLIAYVGQRKKTCYAACRSLKKAFPDLPVAVIADTIEDAVAAEDACPGMGYYLHKDRVSPGLLSRIEHEAAMVRGLRESEQRFSRVFHASPAVFAFTRMSDGYHYDVNDRWLSVLGLKPADVIGKTSKQLKIWANPDDRKRLIAKLKKTPIVRDFEAKFRTKSGELRDFLITVERMKVDGEDRLLFLANDVTEIKRTGEELKRRHAVEKLIGGITKAFLEKKPDAAIRFSLGKLGGFLGVDFLGVYRFDMTPGVMVNTHAWTLADKHKAPKCDLSKDTFVYCAARFDAGEPSIARQLSDLPKWAAKERRALKKQGVKSMANLPLMVKGKAIGCLSADAIAGERDWSSNDIELLTSAAEAISLGMLAGESERQLKQTLKDREQTIAARTADLRASEARLRDMTDAASDWRWETDSKLRFSAQSSSIERILGIKPKDLIGKRREDIAWVDVETGGICDRKAMDKHLDDLHAHKPFRDFRYTVRRPDGELRHVRISGKPVFDAKGKFTGYRGTGTDATVEVEAARAAARAQAQLADAIESIDGGLLLLDRNLNFVLCNSRYREECAALAGLLQAGASFEDIVRASVERGVVDIGAMALDEWVAQRLSPPDGLKRETEQKQVNGRWGVVYDYVTREGGRLIVRTDITARKQAEEALQTSEKYRRIVLDTVLDGIITIDKTGTVQSLNPAAENLFGYGADEVIGRNVSMLMPEPYSLEHDAYLRRYMETGEARIIGIGREVKGLRKDGTVFPLDLAVSQAEVDGEFVFVGVIRDISERQKSEQDLRRARFEAEASNKAKSQFLANMSHELRTPLNAILGFSETISSEIFGPVGNARYLDYIRDIQISGQHLLNLINDILDLSKIEAGAFTLSEEEADIAELVNACLALVSAQSHERDIAIQTKIDAGVSRYRLDLRRMKQVVLNLLSNAVKFSDPGGTVVVSAMAEADGTLLLAVRDDGIGMSMDEIEMALSEFGQVQSEREHSRAHEGTGLGLPLSRNLVLAHGGRLEIESKQGEGTRVTVRLPALRRVD